MNTRLDEHDWPEPGTAARMLHLSGHVQGVGFRPFVYRLAEHYGLNGWVENQLGQVAIFIEGSASALDQFQHVLIEQAPAASRPQLEQVTHADNQGLTSFTIRSSTTTSPADIHVTPDLALCDECRAELHTATDNRYHYSFINCTQCGPRYTIIRSLPYDRANTTMRDFSLCPSCEKEYNNTLDRRFHAEPIACPVCGPQLEFRNKSQHITGSNEALLASISALRDGDIIAVKGIGGYHLVCDANNDDAIAHLRNRKHRPDKPLAVMLPWQQLSALNLTTQQREILTDPAHPILLVEKHRLPGLSENIAPDLNEIGIMLPYSPLHDLLTQLMGNALVMTSANLSGEPVLTEAHDVEQRLGHIADGFLHHNRPIQRPADDPVLRIIQEKPRPLRLGRGNAPLELHLPRSLHIPVLAVGSHMKNTVALAFGDRIIISPHIGELDSPRSQEVFESVIDDLQKLYQVRAQQIVCDAHPGYASTRWAKQVAMHNELDISPVYHHAAHAGVLAGEFPLVKRWLAFSWDGTGLGEDNNLWGGEALLGHAGDWQRVGSLKTFRLPGGDKAITQPWRLAHALHWQIDSTWQDTEHDTDLLFSAWQRQLNSPLTSSAGRLFDAAAAMLGLAHETSFDAQAAMALEALAADTPCDAIELSIAADKQGILRINWSPLLAMLCDDTRSPCERAACFHDSLAHAILQQALMLRQQHGEFAVGLCGGVFQNKRLAETAMRLLTENDFDVYLPEQVPMNDAGLCYGQVINVLNRFND